MDKKKEKGKESMDQSLIDIVSAAEYMQPIAFDSNPQDPEIAIEIIQGPQLMSRYLRNHKAGNTKRLRCFPGCLPSGHKAQGFCGGAVIAILSTKL